MVENIPGATCRMIPSLWNWTGFLLRPPGLSLTQDPATHVQPLSRPTSDHIPYVIHIGSNIPKYKLSRFENYWAEHPGFLENVSLHWNNSLVYANTAKNISSKMKHVRAGLRNWSKNLSNLNKLIYNCNWVLSLMDGLEDQRPLSRLESIFRGLVKSHLSSLLK